MKSAIDHQKMHCAASEVKDIMEVRHKRSETINMSRPGTQRRIQQLTRKAGMDEARTRLVRGENRRLTEKQTRPALEKKS